MTTATALGFPDPEDDLPAWLKTNDGAQALPSWLRAEPDPRDGVDGIRKWLDSARERATRAAEARRRWETRSDDRLRSDTGPLWSPTPLVGYRMWDVTLSGLVGRTGYRWPSPVLEAECRRNLRGQKVWNGAPHRRDEDGCRGLCGVNAFREAERLVADAMNHPVGFRPGRQVLEHRGVIPSGAYGAVSMWGRVIEHELGYRSQRARTMGVIVVTNTWAGAIVGEGPLTRFFDDPFETFRDREAWMPISLDRTDPAAARTTMTETLEMIGGSP